MLAGRDGPGLERLAQKLTGEVKVRAARIEAEEQLRELLTDAAVVINAAGPFSETSRALAGAASACGTHYVDTTAAEQKAMHALMKEYGEAATKAGVAVVPAMGFFGAIADMLTNAASKRIAGIDSVEIGYHIKNWIPTPGTVRTRSFIQGRYTYCDRTLQFVNAPPNFGPFDFGELLGKQIAMYDYPAGEVLSIPKRLPVNRVSVNMAAEPLKQMQGIEPEVAFAATDEERAASDFLLVVRLNTVDRQVTMTAKGKDIYGITAPIAMEAAQRLMCEPIPGGVLAASEAFDAESFLSTLIGPRFNYTLSERHIGH